MSVAGLLGVDPVNGFSALCKTLSTAFTLVRSNFFKVDLNTEFLIHL